MAFTTPNLGLIVWNLPSDPYDSTQLGGNWAKMDEHDHTSGKGLPITTAAIADGSVTSVKLAADVVVPPSSITGTEIAPGSITTAHIADGTIAFADLGANILPTGLVLPFANTSAPTGWLVCDGSPVSQTTYANLFSVIGTNYNTGGEGAGNFRLPSLQGRFPFGADGTHLLHSTGGSLTHNHTVPNHAHSGATSLSGSATAVAGSTGGHVHNAPHWGGLDKGYVVGYFGDSPTNTGDHDPTSMIVGSPGASQSSVPVVFDDITANAIDSFSGASGSASVSGTVTVGGGSDPSSATVNTGNNSAIPSYLSLNFIIRT